MPSYESGNISFDNAELRSSFEKKPFPITHNLVGHPLFEIPALLDAGNNLPSHLIECNAGDVPINLPEGRTAGDGQSHRQIYERMAEQKVWLGLKNIDLIPEYRLVIQELLESVRDAVEESHPGMYNFEGYLFMSSPGTVVPYHMDPEHNFLLQIRGCKTLHLLDRHDPEVLNEAALERYYTATNRRLVFDPDLHERATPWHLKPGQGMSVPVTFPHYVANGDEMSVSLSVTFDTPRQQARARIYKVNHYLRRVGLPPRPYGVSRVRDLMKSTVGSVYQKLFG